MPKKACSFIALLCILNLTAQDYFLEKYQPYDKEIPSPEAFLGYGIGERHTRHDLMVAYFKELARISERATLTEYGQTYEGRKLIILNVSSAKNIQNMEAIRKKHLQFTDPSNDLAIGDDLPIVINLGYNVHGNEPSGGESALLTAYALVASNHPDILTYIDQSIILIDPVINPDGRDRHTQYVNAYQGTPLVADPNDAEHNEYWPRGRTNHYWFDLNRDWLLGIHPESRGKLNWYHQWYPNVVTDFHEMGTQSSYFFEPMKDNGSLDPIMPKENYEDLNDLFGEYFASALDSIGSFYFSREVFDGTYPGYGSSYPDLQGGLGLLFEQASSRGHKQTTAYGEISFPFTIRNQFVSSMTTVKAAVENKSYLRKYQQNFFKSALVNASKSKIKGYQFEERHDQNRLKAFIDKLLLHKVDVYEDNGKFTVPTDQPQYRMVQTFFETYEKYRDSVYYDASAWSLANFYNIAYKPTYGSYKGNKLTSTESLIKITPVTKTEYAYLIDYDDYNAIAMLHHLQANGITVASSFKPFTLDTSSGKKAFNYGTLIVPVSLQKKSSKEVFTSLLKAQQKYQVPVYSVSTGYTAKGIDLGSRYVRPIQKPMAAMLIGDGVRSYEAGEVWHLLDQRVHMPITKIPMRNLNRTTLDDYNTLVMVSGRYPLSKERLQKIKDWVSKGNTLITIGNASKWVIDKKIVKEELVGSKKDSSETTNRKPYVDAPENLGKDEVGGIILQVDIDTTHPLSFGYRDNKIPVYKNNEVWLKPSENEYSTVAQYTKKALIDGFISERNKTEYLAKSASLVVSKVGSGRVVLFADNPNFRGSWYGTNRLFLNALFLGNHIRVPD